MNRYTCSNLRKNILADGHTDSTVVRAALVIIECIDWKTNERSFAGRIHLTNWLKHIGGQYAVDPALMAKGKAYLTSMGFLDLTNTDKGGLLLRTCLIPSVS